MIVCDCTDIAPEFNEKITFLCESGGSRAMMHVYACVVMSCDHIAVRHKLRPTAMTVCTRRMFQMDSSPARVVSS